MTSPVRRRVLIFSGGADYLDPWHPFSETSAIVAKLLRDIGLEVVVTDRVDDLLARSSAPRPDLLIVNAGSGPEEHSRDSDLLGLFRGHVETGGALLVLHVAATLFKNSPDWEKLIGGRWVRGRSMHPEGGQFRLEVEPIAHPITTGLPDLETVDEAYARLRVEPASEVLVSHVFEGERHPLLWTWQAGGGPVVYDALGHDRRAYDSAVATSLLTRSAAWLLDR